jgi:hypothetical protein
MKCMTDDGSIFIPLLAFFVFTFLFIPSAVCILDSGNFVMRRVGRREVVVYRELYKLVCLVLMLTLCRVRTQARLHGNCTAASEFLVRTAVRTASTSRPGLCRAETQRYIDSIHHQARIN